MKFSYFLQDRVILDNGYAALSPSVSIVMPTYSRMAEGFLSRCIDSVLGQSYRDFEFIIIDDGSTDGSQALITEYAKKDSRIVYVRHDENSGLPAVRTNEGILLARAGYVAFIFDDNIWEKDALSVMMESMQQAPVDVLHANTRMVQDEKNSVDLGGWPLSIELLQYSNTIPNGAVLCNRGFFDCYGLYDPHLSLRRICDWDLWRRAARFGASFRHLNLNLGIELGPSSPVSLGNSVKMDYKVAFAYMMDEAEMASRIETLKPASIERYDVFDPLKVFPYIRDEQEWKEFQGAVYQPFYEKHPNFSEPAPAIHNRSYEDKADRCSLNAYGSIFRDKKRALIVCNRYTPLVEDWKSAFESRSNCIAVTCAEWQASAFEPGELDYLILMDCTALFLKPVIQKCRDQNVAVGYVVMHGADSPAPVSNPLKRLEFTSHDSVWETFKTDIYFPHFAVPWSEDEKVGATALMSLAHQVFLLGDDAGAVSLMAGIKAVSLPYLPMQHETGKAAEAGGVAGAQVLTFYLGDPSELPATELGKTVDAARRLKRQFAVSLLMVNECGVPAVFAEAPDMQDCIARSDESLLSWVRHFQPNGLVIVPDAIADQVGEYCRYFIEDELAAKGAALIRLSELPVGDQSALDGEWMASVLSSVQERIASKHAQSQGNCRLTQFACAVDSLLLKRQMATVRTGSQKIAVLLNSPLFAGSEAYGLLLARALIRMGFDVMTCVPNIHGYGDVKPDDINQWLKENGMPAVTALNYGFGIQSFDYPPEYCRAHSRQFNDWLDQQDVSLLLCVGFIPDPLITESKAGRAVFMALFQPWGYPLDKMTFLRDRVAGIMADSDWSASHWARWLPPPVVTVPTPLIAGRLKCLNASLQGSPIQIAVGGTLQPRKRQKEAIEAVRELRSEGYDVHLNIYGYELSIVSDYVRETKALIEAYQLGDVVKLHGLVELEEIFSRNHVILSTSLDESLPQTLIFAMAAGLVAVACPAGGIPEIVIDGETGYLGTGFSIADVKAVLKRALDHRSDWPDIQARAVRYVSRRHGELNVSQQLLSVLNEGLAIEKSLGRRLFPLGGGGPEEHASLPKRSSLHQWRIAAQNKSRNIALRVGKKLVAPYLSPRMKNRIRVVLHRTGIL